MKAWFCWKKILEMFCLIASLPLGKGTFQNNFRLKLYHSIPPFFQIVVLVFDTYLRLAPAPPLTYGTKCYNSIQTVHDLLQFIFFSIFEHRVAPSIVLPKVQQPSCTHQL